MSRLTHKRKQDAFSIIVPRDGYVCFYCEGTFSENHPAEYDHLNNNPNDSRPENLVLCHHECNVKKRTFGEWQTIAQDRLRENENHLSARERRQPDLVTGEELTSQQSINKINRPKALQFIQEHLLMEDELIQSDTVNAIVSICQDNNQTGSQAAVRRYIDEFTNPYTGKYTLSTNSQGKTIIRRRTEN